MEPGERKGTSTQRCATGSHTDGPWRISFVRAYDMTDPLVSVLRSVDLEQLTMVDASSVEFTITLPKRVNGDLTLSVGLVTVADELLGLAWSAPQT